MLMHTRTSSYGQYEIQVHVVNERAPYANSRNTLLRAYMHVTVLLTIHEENSDRAINVTSVDGGSSHHLQSVMSRGDT